MDLNVSKHRPVAYDCVNFLGDRPCTWHKKEKYICKCEKYASINGQILVIKLDAVGDVLRTTCLLPVIAKNWPETWITWITRPESVPILKNNPYINEILTYGTDAVVHLITRDFSRVVNLDAGKISAGLASMTKSESKVGFFLKNEGYVNPTNESAEEWLRMGIFDDLKKKNQKTYQDIMCGILHLPSEGMRYVLELTKSEIEEARRHLTGLGVKFDKTIIGIHTGGGGRWKHKQWREDGFIGLVNSMIQENPSEFQVVVFGGQLERELNQRILNSIKFPVFDTGCDNDLRHFAALIGQCSVIISGDSLAMHIALATGRRVVALFGPTSSSEIELFELGEKVFPELDCLCCYKTECDCLPNCMDLITVEMVKAAVLRQVKLLSA
jgi:ADP-heptose:LPS heptosyltransferase